MYEQKIQKFLQEIAPYVFHQKDISHILLISLFTGGSLLIEDLPGSGKTTLAKALAKLFGFKFSRVHATSDLNPQDILGGEFYDLEKKEIQIKFGPIFSELFLVDEINRMNPKTQSAFLQAMEEKSVTLASHHYDLGKYFRVIATQNPIEHTGTFSLPEAQLDRFLAKVTIGAPSKEIQQQILMQNTSLHIAESLEKLTPIFERSELDEILSKIHQVHLDENLAKRMVDFFHLLKEHQNILYPLSQRGISLFLLATKANAFLHQRDYITPTDGYEIIPYVLYHRLNIEKNSHHIIQELYKDAFKNF